MDQVAMKAERIIRLDGSFDFWPAAAEVLVHSRGMMVDDYNYASDLLGLSRRGIKSGVVEKFAEPRYLTPFKIMGMRAFEKRTLRTNHKCDLVAPVRLNFTQLPD
jgi:hypothetical protein